MLDQRREFDAFSFSGCLSTKGWLRAQTTFPRNLLTLALVLATPGCRRVDIQEAEKYPFLRAAVHRNAKELRKLIDQGSKVNQQQDGNRKTALHWVAELHDSNSARILLASGADVEMQDRSGRTALWYGAESLEMVQLLLAAGARAESGRSSVLMRAIDADHAAETVSSLIAAGADVNRREDSWTPLGIAANRGDPETIHKLLAAGAQVNLAQPPVETQDECHCYHNGTPPINGAAGADRVEALKILLAAGADVHATDSRGQTALFEGARRPDAVRLLLEAGADPRVVDHDGATVLTWGFSYSVTSAEQKAEAAKLLIAAGANVNAKDKEGKTALMRVADSGSAPEMRILLDAGARVNERDSSGKTALSVLIARGGEPGDVGGFLLRLISARARSLDEMDKLLRAAGARE